ncbi:MAG: aldo/keto reductase [Rhizobacter sp.]|nr:aldo/keto reductase [Rhizobacter sp.]
MKHTDRRRLPRVDLSVPVFGLGCAQLGGLFRAMRAPQAAELVHAAWGAGVRFFDTAPYYGYTLSERRLGAELAAYPRDAFILSTKAGRLMRPDASVRPGDDGFAEPLPFRPCFDYSFDGVMRSFDDSLQRLGLAQIDILFIHDIGRVTHGERHAHHWQQLTQGGGFRALDTLRREGRVRAVGLGVNEWEAVHEALQEFDLDVSMLAGRYTLLEQQSLVPLLDTSLKRGHAIVVAGPFNSGVLAGAGTFNYAQAPAEVLERVQALQAVCREFDVPLPAAALQFPLAHPAVVSCVAGAHDATQLQQNIAWLEQRLPDALWGALRERGLIDERAPVPGAA